MKDSFHTFFLTLLAISILSFSFETRAASLNYFITTDQTGAQTQIDFQHASIWNFTPGGDVNVLGANFTLKDGSQTKADISFYVYQGTYSLTTDSAGGIILPAAPAILAKTLTNSDFGAQVSTLGGNSDQNWNWHEFLIGTVSNPFYTLLGGTAYTAVVYSDASKKSGGVSDSQSSSYFIKDGALVFNQDPTNPSQQNLAPSLVPEPSASSLLVAALACLGLAKGRRWFCNRS